jgi:hypothetical protein
MREKVILLTKKLTYEFIDNFFSKNSCELLENEYINAHEKMKFKCHCGKISEISFDKFKIALQCKDCGRKKLGEGKKHSYDYVYNYFLSKGCELLEEKYINGTIKMKYKCICGKESFSTFHNFRIYGHCKECGYKDLSEKLKLSYEEVYNYYKKYNCELLEDIYNGIYDKMKFKCSCGKVDYMSFVGFKSGHHVCHDCAVLICADQKRHSYDFVKQYIESFGYKLLSNYYVGANEKLEIKCDKEHIYYSTFHNFKDGKHRCPKCDDEFKVGENHPGWNPNKSNEDRIKDRHLFEYFEWRKQVFERDNYTCQICGKRGGKLNAHHLDAWHWCEEKRFVIENGITLCNEHHNPRVIGSFHDLYGNKNNTKEQFEEYKQNQQLILSQKVV